jgi:hypothetical protein
LISYRGHRAAASWADRADPLNFFIVAVGLGLSWPLLAGYVADDAKRFGPATIMGSLALKTELLWWRELRLRMTSWR